MASSIDIIPENMPPESLNFPTALDIARHSFIFEVQDHFCNGLCDHCVPVANYVTAGNSVIPSKVLTLAEVDNIFT
jgi:hypothetical protein